MTLTLTAYVSCRNVPESAMMYPFIVARYVDGAWWYWGAYSDEDYAYRAAREVGGEVFTL